jgi:hypothetical protein
MNMQISHAKQTKQMMDDMLIDDSEMDKDQDNYSGSRPTSSRKLRRQGGLRKNAKNNHELSQEVEIVI